MNELDVNQDYSFSYPGIGGFYGGYFLLSANFKWTLLICTVLINWLVYGVAMLYDTDCLDCTLLC